MKKDTDIDYCRNKMKTCANNSRTRITWFRCRPKQGIDNILTKCRE